VVTEVKARGISRSGIGPTSEWIELSSSEHTLPDPHLINGCASVGTTGIDKSAILANGNWVGGVQRPNGGTRPVAARSGHTITVYSQSAAATVQDEPNVVPLPVLDVASGGDVKTASAITNVDLEAGAPTNKSHHPSRVVSRCPVLISNEHRICSPCRELDLQVHSEGSASTKQQASGLWVCHIVAHCIEEKGSSRYTRRALPTTVNTCLALVLDAIRAGRAHRAQSPTTINASLVRILHTVAAVVSTVLPALAIQGPQRINRA
jgi:hypothetical protein